MSADQVLDEVVVARSPGQAAADILANYRRRHGQDPRWGCSLVSHRDLGFCSQCHPHGYDGELTAWRLLAMAHRGLPDMPASTA